MDHKIGALDEKHSDRRDDNNGMRTAVSITPVVVAVVTLLVIVFLLVSYYRLLSSCFKNWISRGSGENPNPPQVDAVDVDHPQQQQPEDEPVFLIRSSALSKSLIQRLPVLKNSSSKRLADCAVCLGDFADGEEVKILPKCRHGFHVACIDTWLSNHSNLCPLCRTKVEDIVVAVAALPEDPRDRPSEESDPAANPRDEEEGGNRDRGEGRSRSRRKSSSLDEEGSRAIQSLFGRFSSSSLSSASPPDPDQEQQQKPEKSENPASNMRRSWSASRVFSIRRGRQQQQSDRVIP